MDWRRRFVPGAPDLVFGLVLASVMIGGSTGLLNDPGTCWHLRLGREIIRTGAVPRFDTLTYTRDHVAWVDQSWAFDLGLALVVDRWGWSAAIALTALALAGLYGALARGLLRNGNAPIVAVMTAVLAAGVGAHHFLVRPHLFTLMFVLWVARACRVQHERGGWAIAIVPGIMVAWANVHGGFLAGPVIVLTAALGHAASGPWDRARRVNVARFTAVFVLACLAPLINPYGPGLYRHVGHLLVGNGVTQLINEYQPIPFGKAEARVAEWVVLGLIALPSLSTRRLSRYDLAHILLWLHLALGTIRHAPLFALIAAPGLAGLIDGLPLSSRAPGRGRVGRSCWPWAAVAALALAVVGGVRLGGFSPKTWPLGALPILNGQPIAAPLFHEQDWGGMIEAECRPIRRAYLDDRFELFDKETILEYVDALQGGPKWEILRERERIALVWVRPERGLAGRLEADPLWSVLYRDRVSILFARRDVRSDAASSVASLPALDEGSSHGGSSGNRPARVDFSG